MPQIEERQCDVCKDLPPIKIYDGPHGDLNWQRHLSGTDHKKAKAKASAKSGANILDFFKRKPSAASEPSQKQSPRLPANSTRPQPRPIPPSSSIIIDRDDHTIPTPFSPTPSHPSIPSPREPTTNAIINTPAVESETPSTLATPTSPNINSQSPNNAFIIDQAALERVQEMRSLAASLPPSVKIATEHGPLAWMKFGAALSEVSPQDAWEEFDPQLNRLFGTTIPQEDIDAVIERGEFGVDALCFWFDEIIRKYGIGFGLIDHKTSRIMTSLRQW